VKNREKLQNKADIAMGIIETIDFKQEVKSLTSNGFEYKYYEGETNGCIKNKILVARRLLLEISRDLQ
jgi:hypothetical protein